MIIRSVVEKTDIARLVEFERRKDEFISSASHELKTPLATIKGFTQVLKELLKKDMKALYYLSKLESQTDRITLLVNDLLDVSKIKSGKLDLRFEPFFINKLIKEVIEDMYAQSTKHKIIFKPNANIKVRADYFRLYQVFINIISNAVKYSPKADKIVVYVRDLGTKVEVVVEDFGIGIAEKNLEKIFEKFFQVENKIRPSFSGLGLGLHISEEIIKRHKGRIWVESEKGKGSQFKFVIPKSIHE